MQMERSGSSVQEGGKQAHSAPSKAGVGTGTGSALGGSKEELDKGKAAEDDDPPKDTKKDHGLKKGKRSIGQDKESSGRK